MMPGIDKNQVERQFSRAARTYDQAARVQHQMSDQLIDLLGRYLDTPPTNILDMGCGTGYSLLQLKQQFPDTRITGLDLSGNMLAIAREHLPEACFIQADMECYVPEGNFDLIFSNASVQWCDLDAVLIRVRNALKPGGLFIYSSFGPGTHLEIARAWNLAHPGAVHHIDFLDKTDHLSALEQAGFSVLEQQEELFQPRFDSALSLLDSVKQTGATNAATERAKGLLSRDTYARFLECLAQSNPIGLSYQALSFVTRLPG